MTNNKLHYELGDIDLSTFDLSTCLVMRHGIDIPSDNKESSVELGNGLSSFGKEHVQKSAKLIAALMNKKTSPAAISIIDLMKILDELHLQNKES